jgi:hypothetical protein
MPDRPEIINDAAVAEAWLAKRRWPPRKDRVNHASKIGHPCDRYLTLRRTHGDLAAPPSLALEAIFARGEFFESLAVAQLEAAGWKVWDQQKVFDLIENGEVLLSCRMDCLSKPPDSPLTYVVDHKTVNPHDWAKIPRGWDGYEYLKASEKPWLRAWPAQLTTYMYVHPGSAEVGLLQLINPEVPLPKFVYVPFDAEYMQSIIDRARRVNEYAKAVMAAGMLALPKPIDWSESVCGRCELLGVCLPDQMGRSTLELLEDPAAEELVAQDRELAARLSEVKREYDAIHDRVKHLVGDREEVVIGNFWITQKEVNVKERLQKAYSYKRMDVKPLVAGEQKEEDAA